MKMLSKYVGKLMIDVASEGKYIPAGTDVVIEEQESNFETLSVLVTSMKTSVRLGYYDTDINALLNDPENVLCVHKYKS